LRGVPWGRRGNLIPLKGNGCSVFETPYDDTHSFNCHGGVVGSLSKNGGFVSVAVALYIHSYRQRGDMAGGRFYHNGQSRRIAAEPLRA